MILATINDASLAELNRTLLERAIQCQNAKKKDLLSKARNINNIKKKVELLGTKSQERRKTLFSHIEFWRGCDFTLSNLSQLVEDMNSKERFNQYRGMIGVRKLLSVASNPIQSVINANLIPRMIEFLQIKDEPQLQFEAAQALSNITSGTTDQAKILLDKGAIFWLIELLSSNNQELIEQATWTLGNIAGDSTAYRDRVLANGALQPLLKVVEHPKATENIIKHGTWAISNLCRGRPLPGLEKVRSAIPTLCKIMYSQTDPDILVDAAWALSYCTRIQNTLEDVMKCPEVISALVSQLGNPFLNLMIPCLRTLGNLSAGNETQTDAVIDQPEFFEKMYSLMDHRKEPVRRESIWVLTNIAGGSEKQRTKMFQSFPFVETLISCCQNDVVEVKREAVWVFKNTLRDENISEFFLFWNAGVLSCYITLLQTANDDSILRVVLEGVYHMLRIGRKVAADNKIEENMVLVELEKAGLFDKFDELQDHNNPEIKETVIKILQEFIPSIEIKPQTEEADGSDEDDEDY